jgi:cyclopropane fatty-acyl-phospholipid synthase-like methyltransferase
MNETWSKPVTVQEMYGDWDYEAAVAALDRSLSPRPAASIFDVVGGLGVEAGDVLLDIGGREGQHGLVMAERFGCRVVSVDPVTENIERGRQIVGDHEYGHMVDVKPGSIEQIPAEDNTFRLIFSRDMLGHIADLELALVECRRVLSGGGHMVIHEVFATPMLEPDEARRLCADSASVPERMSVAVFEAAVAATGFEVQSLDVVGSEWAEASQEAGTAPNHLLQVARLRRAKDRLMDELGEAPYRVMYANALWSIYQLIGKLESRVYVLRQVAT